MSKKTTVTVGVNIAEIDENRLAELVHTSWMKAREESGWSVGSRNDKKKNNPCMVPYQALSPEEQQIDKAAVRTTVEALLEANYQIISPVEIDSEGSKSLEFEKKLEYASKNPHRIFLCGEPGSGKSHAAEKIVSMWHEYNKIENGGFRVIDCAVLHTEIANSELFGHTKNAFTGALKDKPGAVEEIGAHGVIFLDEICELSPDTQKKLLRFLQTGEHTRLGDSTKIYTSSAKIIAASNMNVEEALASGRLRQDLYDRFCGFQIRVPPLRERKDQIRSLIDSFRKDKEFEFQAEKITFAEEIYSAIERYNHPQNIRGLKTIIENINRDILVHGYKEKELRLKDISDFVKETFMPVRTPEYTPLSLNSQASPSKNTIETLAKNLHDYWGLRRLQEGVKPTENSRLVMWENLPLIDKNFNREIVIETLRGLDVLTNGTLLEPNQTDEPTHPREELIDGYTLAEYRKAYKKHGTYAKAGKEMGFSERQFQYRYDKYILNEK